MGKEGRRQELLDAARKVFAEKGYHDAKVNDISAAAHVAKGTFYLYFPDKRSVFVELIDTLFVRISTAILRVDTDGDVTAQIKHNIRAILSVLVDHPESLRILIAFGASVDPSVSKKIEAFYAGLKDLLAASLVDGQNRGIVAAGDVRLYATFTIGALKEILSEAINVPQGRRTREQIVEEMFSLLCSGYLRINPGNASSA